MNSNRKCQLRYLRPHVIVLMSLTALTGLTRASVPATRVIQFPHDHSLGMISVGDLRPTDPMWWQGWRELGEARGAVKVPADRSVLLRVSASDIEYLPGLAMLGTDDVQAIAFDGADRVDDSALEHLRLLAGLQLLDLSGTSVANGLESLTKMRSLEALKLSGTQVGDEGMEHVGRLLSLRSLELGATPITDEGLVHLRNLNSLQLLWLNHTSISGKGFSHLTGLDALREVHLSDTGITDEGVMELAKLTTLESLFLDNTKVGDAGMDCIQDSTTLRELTLQGTRITNAGLGHLGKIVSLETLELPRGTTTAGLQKLAALTRLKHLKIVYMRREGKEPVSLTPFKQLEYLYVPQGSTDADLYGVSTCSHLRELWIENSSITDEGLAHLAALKSLQRLGLHNGSPNVKMEVTVGGLDALKELPLTFLLLYSIKLDGARLVPLLAFPTLEELHLLEMPIQDEDLNAIGKLSRLKYLRFTSNTVSDGGIGPLANLQCLENLTPWVPLTDEAMQHIGKMRCLRQLQVKGVFTDAGLRGLEGLESLRGLVMTTGGPVTPAGLERLKTRLPHLTVRLRETEEKREAPRTGAAVPDFALTTLNREELRREAYRGKVVVLYFWATWCTPCKASTPALKRMYTELVEQYPERFAILGLSLDDGDTLVRSYVRREEIPWPQVRLGRDSQMAAAYGVIGVPTYVVVAPDGAVVILTHDLRECSKAVRKALD